MTFEFVIVYQREEGVNIRDILLGRLLEVLTDNLNEFDIDVADRMISLTFERSGPMQFHRSGPLLRARSLLGFALELPDDTASARTVVDDFADALVAAPIDHVVKFDDSLLRVELALRAQELFDFEMKLRRVITIIYLHAYRDRPYDLLRDETQKPMHPPQEPQMRAAAENEFFFLTFGQYVDLNRRPDMRQLPALVNLIRSTETYEALRQELEREPVEHEDDAVFLAGLRERMNAIDAMRNCVAHNRRPSREVVDNYDNARPLLDKLLNEYLARWQREEAEAEMPWDRAAREAVEEALENADWKEKTKTIRLYDPDDDRESVVVSTIGELRDHLEDVASDAFYGKVPRPNGEPTMKCDAYGIVETALSEYEDRLSTFFAESGESPPAT
jgi:hypothetical protein